jgi:hypothetical protein
MKELIIFIFLTCALAHIALLLVAVGVPLILAIILAVGIIWGISKLRN